MEHIHSPIFYIAWHTQYVGDQYSQIPCAAHKARLENLESYAAYFGIEGILIIIKK